MGVRKGRQRLGLKSMSRTAGRPETVGGTAHRCIVLAAFDKEQADNPSIFTPEADSLPSQISPNVASHVTSDMTLRTHYVLLCDWRGPTELAASPSTDRASATCAFVQFGAGTLIAF